MKVKVSETVEVDDEQRKQIAAVIDGGEGKKRDATREEMKDFIWAKGEHWETHLRLASTNQEINPAAAEVTQIDVVHEDTEDLIGEDPSLEDLI